MTASAHSISHCSSLVLCTQMCTLGYEWAFVRLLNRPLCHVSRLEHLPWKWPSIPFTRMTFIVSLCNVDSPVFYYYVRVILVAFLSHFYSDTMEYAMKKTIEEQNWGFWFPPHCCQHDTVRSSRKLNYHPHECIMISFRFKSGSVDCLCFSNEWAVVRP